MSNFFSRLLSLTVVAATLGSSPICADSNSRRIEVGRFKARALWTPAGQNTHPKSPVIIMVPGSGANGPEEMMPASLSGDKKDHSLFGEIARPLNKQGIATLAVGNLVSSFSVPGTKRNTFTTKTSM